MDKTEDQRCDDRDPDEDIFAVTELMKQCIVNDNAEAELLKQTDGYYKNNTDEYFKRPAFYELYTALKSGNHSYESDKSCENEESEIFNLDISDVFVESFKGFISG